MKQKRIFSGMQPTNRLQLGNYLGALKNWVELQNEGDNECIFCVVDLHAITKPYDNDGLAQATREVAAAYIAAGIDTDKSILFAQSSVPGHSQLMWLLATMAQMGKLSRMTQFKDKAGKNTEKAGLGLYSYPVLIHFIQPEPYIMGEGARVMSLRDGTSKMSKSAESDMTRINLTDDADLIAKKIKKAKTDAEPVPANESEFENLSGEGMDDVFAQFGGKNFGEFKPALIDVAVAHLEPITTKMNHLMQSPDEIDKILAKGGERCNAMAQPLLDKTMDIMGFWKG